MPDTDSSAVDQPVNDAQASPAPLVPAEVDLRGMSFMPLDVARLRDSDLAIEATGDEFRAAVLLWCAAWVQVPAASLPDSNRALAAYAGFGRHDVKGWQRVRAGALRGFVRCSDGRLYHPVVAEKALEAWAERQAFKDRRENESERLARHRQEHKDIRAALRSHGIIARWNEPIEALRDMLHDAEQQRNSNAPETRTGPLPVTAKTGTGTGTGTGSISPRAGDARAHIHAHARTRVLALLDEQGIPYRTTAASRDPSLVTAMARDFDLPEVEAAIERARRSRAEQDDNGPIPISYIDAILRRPQHASSSGNRPGAIARADQVGDEFLARHGDAQS